MTIAAIEKQLARMQADIKELKQSAKLSATASAARARLRAEILKGIASGPGKTIDRAYWKRLRALARRHARKA